MGKQFYTMHVVEKVLTDAVLGHRDGDTFIFTLRCSDEYILEWKRGRLTIYLEALSGVQLGKLEYLAHGYTEPNKNYEFLCVARIS